MAQPPVGLYKDAIREIFKAPGKPTANPWDDDEPGTATNDARYTRGLGLTSKDDLATRATKARSWLFLESFERFFGLYAKPADLDILTQEMQYVESLPPAKQFISPVAYQTIIFGRAPANRKSARPLPPVESVAPGRNRFVYYLRAFMPGYFWWKEGRSDAFTNWLKDGAGSRFEPSSVMNCWEMVFFAAIRTQFMNPADLKAAYDTKGDPSQVLMNTFSKKMILYDAAKGTPPKLEAGDIIVSNLAENFHHVFAVADMNKPINELKIVQLWGDLGAGVTFYWNMGEFLSLANQVGHTEYYVLKL